MNSGQQLNRPKEVIRMQSKKKNTTSRNWFNQGKTSYDSVLFVPSTPNSALAKTLREHEALNNQGRVSRIKIVEKAGRSLKSILAPNDPWGVSKCADPECFVCSTSVGDLKVSCRTPGILYKIFCTRCEEEGKKSVYVGQSGKNGYSRGKKHLEDFAARNNSHCMVIHCRVHHPNEQMLASNFRMVPIRAYHTPLERQISEGLCIYNSDVDVLLNSGTEWMAGQVPRASVARTTGSSNGR